MARIGDSGGPCRHCGRPLKWGHVDYSDTPGWVHDDDGEPMCRPDDTDSPQAAATHDREEVTAT